MFSVQGFSLKFPTACSCSRALSSLKISGRTLNDLGPVYLPKYLAFFLSRPHFSTGMSGFVLCAYSKSMEMKTMVPVLGVSPKWMIAFVCSGALSSLKILLDFLFLSKPYA